MSCAIISLSVIVALARLAVPLQLANSPNYRIGHTLGQKPVETLPEVLHLSQIRTH